MDNVSIVHDIEINNSILLPVSQRQMPHATKDHKLFPEVRSTVPLSEYGQCEHERESNYKFSLKLISIHSVKEKNLIIMTQY